MSVFSNPAFDGHERVVFAENRAAGLRAIIAIHDTRLGAGVGGCRMYPYSSDDEALRDVLRLSRGMTYKSALAGLPFGGGKSVIIGDPRADKTPRLLAAMAEFIHGLGGQYVAAEDSGIGVDDIRAMSRHTPHVSGLQEGVEHGGDPSPSTAYGVYLGIRTAVRYRMGSESLDGLKVAIQGLGNVGFHLAGLLRADGAVVYGADVNQDNLRRASVIHGVKPVETGAVLALEVDVVAPCAMGAILDTPTVENLRAGIVAGAANNQLASEAQAGHLWDRGILYCPDFLINAGGIIDVFHQRQGSEEAIMREHIARIESNLQEILYRSDRDRRSPHLVAEELAEEYLRSHGTQGEEFRLAG
jgi:leucine dehydrogenase